jgi:SAM-dependent methyltransferase
MEDEVRFAADLYRGTAGHYDQYRLPYPEVMIEDLVLQARISGHGRLLDLACGTGQLAFPLRSSFSEVWAVDREPDMVEVVRVKAAAEDAGDVRPIVSDAETLDAEPEHFELAVIGNAFHRLDRDLVARQILGWLRPGGSLALCWSSSPWVGEKAWQRALKATMDRWRAARGAEHRVPAGWDVARTLRPDLQVLSDAGFEVAGRREFTADRLQAIADTAAALPARAGHGTVTGNLADATLALFGPSALALVNLVATRPALGTALEHVTTAGSGLGDIEKHFTAYLEAEKKLGRIAADTDTQTIAFTLLGSVHHLMVTSPAGLPDLPYRVRRIAEALAAGMQPDPG